MPLGGKQVASLLTIKKRPRETQNNKEGLGQLRWPEALQKKEESTKNKQKKQHKLKTKQKEF